MEKHFFLLFTQEHTDKVVGRHIFAAGDEHPTLGESVDHSHDGVAPMILWGILRPKAHLRYHTGSETAAVPKICRSNINFCKIYCLNAFNSLAQKCGCVRTLQCCG